MARYNNNIHLVDSPRVNRKTRSPQHTWAVKQRPFVITPFMIAPVLPGETFKAGVMQARVVSDPHLGQPVFEHYRLVAGTLRFLCETRPYAARRVVQVDDD